MLLRPLEMKYFPVDGGERWNKGKGEKKRKKKMVKFSEGGNVNDHSSAQTVLYKQI